MIPHLSEERLKAFPSRAEARFYVACRDRLLEDIAVIYSANWIYRDTTGRLKEGEADFIEHIAARFGAPPIIILRGARS